MQSRQNPPLRRCRGERATMRFIYLTNGLPGEGKERSEQTGEHTHTETQVNVKCTSAHIRQIRWDLHRRPTEGGQAERCSKKMASGCHCHQGPRTQRRQREESLVLYHRFWVRKRRRGKKKRKSSRMLSH